MGTYRYFLATIVLISHVPITFDVGRAHYNIGIIAVVSFLLISGYVMQLLVQKRYVAHCSTLVFYIDRVARLAPQCCLYLTIAILLYPWIKQECALSFFWSALNFTLLPLGYYMFTPLNWCSLVIPATWSLGLECSFYAVVPWISRFLSPLLVKVLLLFSITVFMFAFVGLLNTDHYGFRLLPGTLFIFLVGMLIAVKGRVYRHYVIGLYAFFLVLFLVMQIPSSQVKTLHHNMEVILGFLIGVPMLLITRTIPSGSLDRLMGYLSYGVFLNHMIVINSLRELFNIEEKLLLAAITLPISTGLAWVSFHAIEKPVMSWRRRYRQQYIATHTEKRDVVAEKY